MLLIDNIGMLQTPTGTRSACGTRQGENLKIKDAAVLISEGIIVWAGPRAQMPQQTVSRVIDAGGALVTPGLVDCHTHMIFGGWRQHELKKKLAGMGYLDILCEGGGIMDTVRSTRALTQDRLYERARSFALEQLSYGVTATEIKSGYGLDEQTELAQLRAIKQLRELDNINAAATFLGAHAVPEEFSGKPDEYIDFLCEQMLPAVAKEKLAVFCDVFCETGVFTAEQSRRLLTAARKNGLTPKIHADEIDAIGGAQLACEVGAVSAEHLVATTDEGIAALARGNVTAVLLPLTSWYLGKPFARAADMINAGVAVAIATDFNPGSCPCLNLQLALSVGCRGYAMTPEQILTAVTLNAACAAGMGAQCGTIENGKHADLVIWNAADVETLCYRFGSNLAKTVIRNGEII